MSRPRQRSAAPRSGLPTLATRRAFLGTLAAAGCGAVVWRALVYEPNRVTVTRHRLGGTGASIRLVQLSDLHLQRIGAHVRAVAEATTRLAPDLILFTGDSIDDRKRLGELAAFLDLLDASTPKYAVLGNWEHWSGVDLRRLASVYEARNCRLLVNETVVHRYAGHELPITGLDDLIGGTPDVSGALRSMEPRAHHVVLAHCPAQRDTLLARGGATARAALGPTAYVLSGHTHGGQVTFFGVAPFLPRGSGRYLRGWYRDAEPHLYVSRGIGTTTAPVRFGSPPEIAVFELGVSRSG